MGGLGLHGSNPYLSVNRDQADRPPGPELSRSGPSGTSNVLVDGKSIPMDTTAPTVAQALAEAT